MDFLHLNDAEIKRKYKQLYKKKDVEYIKETMKKVLHIIVYKLMK